jgi:hypothetical protein
MDLAMKYTADEVKPYHQMMRIRYVAKSGDHRLAAKQLAEELAKPIPAPNYWDAAVAYSLCVRAAKGDEKLQAEYGDLAIATLKKSIASGSGHFGRFYKDKDLDPLRDRDDFKKMLESLLKPDPKEKGPIP